MKEIFLTLLVLSALKVFAINPDTVYAELPSVYGISYTDTIVSTKDGAAIRTWIYEPIGEPNDITVVLSGSDAGNMSYYIYTATMLTKRGYRVITYDYRGFGQSSNFKIEKDRLYYLEFVTDLTTIIHMAKELNPNSKICLFGHSMGTLINFLAMVEDNDHVSFVVAEGTVSDPHTFIKRVKDIKNKTLILPKSAPAEGELTVKIQNKTDVPMLFFWGIEDDFDDFAPSNGGNNLITSTNRSQIVFKGGHLQGIDVLGEKYFDCFATFVK